MEYFIQAKLISLRKISLMVFSSMHFNSKTKIVLNIDGKDYVPSINKYTSTPTAHLFELLLDFDFPFGSSAYLEFDGFASVVVDVNSAPNFPEFDLLFNYDGPLGSFYNENSTKFYLWAPLANEVFLKLEKETHFKYIKMNRLQKGVYTVEVKGNLINKKYKYLVNNSGVSKEINDPYGKAVSLNSEYSCVIDIEKIKNRKKISPKNIISHPRDAIIYEVNVRDLTEEAPNIVNKGKYLGFIETNKKSKANNPVGLDYLKYLGITHVQLNPITDFANVDDIDCANSYNWGYDVTSFFALEGSYSSNPSDPYKRLEEFKELVDTLHKNNIRVVLDVVYNHIYKYQDSTLENSVPNYFFRRSKDGKIANASGCGNDIASEKYMARRMIVESIKYFVEVFDVDGFRFDLMGLLDIDTINECSKIVNSYKSDALIYGEGWNMGFELPLEQKACVENAAKLSNIGFFNDTFRDVIKGGSFQYDLNRKGYLSGDLDYKYGMDYVLHGSSLPLSYAPKFVNFDQSINFVECHDNYTLFDKLIVSNKEENIETILKRIKLINKLTILSLGVPFIHMGQEFGLSKNGDGNSYNKPKINNFNYDVYDERFDMVESLRNVIEFKNKYKDDYLCDANEIIKKIEIVHEENSLYVIKNKVDNIIMIINPTTDELIYEFPEDYKLIYLDNVLKSDKGIKKNVIPSLNVVILIKR